MKTGKSDFACNLTVLNERERKHFDSVTGSLLASVIESRELENGFELKFANRPDQLSKITEFIERESRCCSFLQFFLSDGRETDSIWLQIRGEKGAKEFLRAELDTIQLTELS